MMSPEDELREANQALGRVRDLCDHWDEISKGETSTTRQIRAAIDGEPDEKPYPDCENHTEVQHRDGKPPWCDYCGWNHGVPAVDPAKYGVAWRQRKEG